VVSRTASPAARPEPERPARAVRESRLQTFLLVGVAAVALAGAGVAVWYKLTHRDEDLSPDLATKFKEKNLALQPPPKPWTQDGNMANKLGTPYILVFKRDNPDAYIAYGAKDYVDREPRPSELRNGLVEPLSKLVEPGTLTQMPIPADTTWLGMEVKGFRFRAQLKTGSAVEGEAYHVSHKGIGYWFLAWTGENEIYAEQQATFAEARRRCKLLELRKDWVAQSNIVPYKNNVVGYTILDADDVWKDITTEDGLKDEGPEADRMLEQKVGGKQRSLPQYGNLIVYVLPAAGDPLTRAKEFVTEKRAAQLRAADEAYRPEFTERTGTPEGEPTGNVIDLTSPVLRLQSKVKNASNQDRLHVISALKIGEKLVVVHAWCDFADRAAFETNFIQIAGSLRAGG
jgi:hypothetical protein